MKMQVARLTVKEPFKSLFPVEPDVVKELTADMRANGFDAAQSIFAWKAPDGQLVVVDGHMRLQSAKAARLGEVHVTVRKFADEDDAFAFAIKMQRVRRNLTQLQIAEAISRAELAKQPPISPPMARSVGARNSRGQVKGSTKDPVKTAVVERTVAKGISTRTAERALANVRAENGKAQVPKPRSRTALVEKPEEAALTPAIAKHLPYPPHLHPLLEAAAKLTMPADLHLIVEHATYSCLELAAGDDSALKAVRAAVSTGARNYRNFNKLVDRTFGTTVKGQS